MQPQPLIAVQDVSVSRNWYEKILGLHSVHGGDEYERMMWNDILVLQLHHWDAHDHRHISEPSELGGRGAILWFQTTEFEETLSRVRAQHVVVLEGPQVNASANHREIWLRDPDGYTVVVAGAPGDI